jgi:ABC-type transporter Mla subunit MlaD
MSEKSPSALSDDELRETLDRLAALSLDMSDRLEEQTKAINRISTATSEARRAAQAAKDQTNPENYGELVGATIDGKINDNLARMGRMATDLLKVSNRTQEVLKKAEDDKSAALRDIWEREQKTEWLKSRLPWFGLGALVLALAMSLLLPRFLASNASACAGLGASWTTTTTGVDACVFYVK